MSRKELIMKIIMLIFYTIFGAIGFFYFKNTIKFILFYSIASVFIVLGGILNIFVVCKNNMKMPVYLPKLVKIINF